MEDLLFGSMSHTTVTLGMLVFAALVAMLLAVIGIYAVINCVEDG